jgi:hypothetical protein
LTDCHRVQAAAPSIVTPHCIPPLVRGERGTVNRALVPSLPRREHKRGSSRPPPALPPCVRKIPIDEVRFVIKHAPPIIKRVCREAHVRRLHNGARE